MQVAFVLACSNMLLSVVTNIHFIDQIGLLNVTTALEINYKSLNLLARLWEIP